mgnify:CR=1 FL=1
MREAGSKDKWCDAWDYVAPEAKLGPPEDVRALLHRFGLRPRKRLGQNFLVDRSVLRRILAAADVDPTDTVLEVGPGAGVLTRELAGRAARVVAVELDTRLAHALQESFAGTLNVEVINADILEFDFVGHLGGGRYTVVANLPYYITSPTLRRFLEARVKPALLVVIVQREVAERISARPGEMSLLSVSVQFYANPCLVAVVPSGAFYPRPEVESAIVRLDVLDRPAVDVDPSLFFRVVQAGFSARRKQLHNPLVQKLGIAPQQVAQALAAVDIDTQRRAQTLSLEEWGALARELSERGLLG